MTAVASIDPAPGDHAPVDACWSRIGVRGDRSCSELATHVHCHNCPVHSRAARIRLDAPASHEDAAEWTRHFARERAVAADADLRSVLIFRVGAEWLAIPTLLCLEVAAVRPIHVLPHRRNAAVLGIANLRGELRVCVSLERLLGLAPTSESNGKPVSGRDTGRLVVIDPATGPIVVPVDEVLGVRRFLEDEIEALPATAAKADSRHTSGLIAIDSRSVGLLDPDLLANAIAAALA